MNYLGPGMEFIDIGANIGYYTMLAAWLVGSQGHVHAFEPTPATYSVLESNAGGRFNVNLNNSAVSSSDGDATFYDFGAALFGRNSVHRHALPREPERIYQVPMITIDNYVQAQGASPDLIKIDAEHSELAIIHGMEETLRVHRPAVSLEVGDLDIPGVPPSRELVAALVSNGYKVFTSTVAGLIPHVAYDRYSYDNLIFLPAERATT
jgi:FkbM family methyltransferase